MRKYPFVLSIPKAGGHLILKMLSLFPEPPPCQWSDHVISFGMRNPLYFDSSVMKILLVRDLRDVFVSLVYWFDAQIEDGLIKRHLASKQKGIDELIQHWKTCSFDEKLTIVLEDGEKSLYYSRFMEENIEEMCHLLNVQNTYVIHFEDLVGPKGGGTLEKQWESIYFFASLFSIELTQEKVEEIGEKMFGNSYPSDFNRTFRKGKIGGWKDAFSEKNLQIFNARYGHFQQALGYFK
ncbi:MAG: hypothetical protein KDK76_01010 [Chlamydiia bacterium]|nr:hypothetical protein [Chlamydiia bacterium]